MASFALRHLLGGAAMMVAAGAFTLAGAAQAAELRLLTWSGYAPDDVVAQFKKETGHDVKVTTSNNEDIISKLRATSGAGFDLAQPSQDRITGAQCRFRHLQADRPEQDQDGAVHPVDARGDQEEHVHRTARSSACRMSGAPTASSSTPQRRRTSATMSTSARPRMPARSATGCGARS